MPAEDQAPIHGLAERLGLRLAAPLVVTPARQTWRAERAGTDCILKCWAATDAGTAPYPVVAHRLLPVMQGEYPRLVLPNYLYDGFDPGVGWYVLLSFVQGVDFRARWHYDKPALAGGLGLAPSDIDLALELAEDLRSIPLDELLANGLQVITPAKAVRMAVRRLQTALDLGLIEPAAAAFCTELLEGWAANQQHQTRLSVSNADFRYLNMVQVSATKTALIDWDDAEASTFETAHCVAYQWLFLWNRDDLQRRLLHRAHEMFGLDAATMRPVLMMRAISQVHTTRAFPARVAVHAKQLLDIVDDGRFRMLAS